LPTYLPKVDVPRPPPPTYVGAQRPNVRWGGGDLRPRRTSQRQVATSNVNVVRGTSLDTPGRARTSLSE
jgi:hypothetical protein